MFVMSWASLTSEGVCFCVFEGQVVGPGTDRHVRPRHMLQRPYQKVCIQRWV